MKITLAVCLIFSCLASTAAFADSYAVTSNCSQVNGALALQKELLSITPRIVKNLQEDMHIQTRIIGQSVTLQKVDVVSGQDILKERLTQPIRILQGKARLTLQSSSGTVFDVVFFSYFNRKRFGNGLGGFAFGPYNTVTTEEGFNVGLGMPDGEYDREGNLKNPGVRCKVNSRVYSYVVKNRTSGQVVYRENIY